MNVFYEEEGGFKVGVILADNDTSLQVEAPHGKRSKIKAASVLLRFAEPAAAAFMDAAQRVAGEVDVDFLWQCCGPDEFAFDTLGREYFGHAPSAVEAGGCCSSCTVRRCISTRKAKAATRQLQPMR